MTDLNLFLLSQTGVDVADGLFSVYTEITVKGGRVQGYLKPLVRNLRSIFIVPTVLVLGTLEEPEAMLCPQDESCLQLF